MIRVLITDDSATLRQLIRTVLETDPDVKVVGEAKNGKEAIALCDKLQPDIITMDLDMPSMNGFEAIGHIMSEMPRPIVVLTSTFSESDKEVQVRAVEAGALLVMSKPNGLPGDDPVADRLLTQVKTMAGVKVIRRRARRKAVPEVKPAPPPPPPKAVEHRRSIELLAVGASTGGPPALQELLKQVPASIPVPIVIVQHISRGFVTGMARWLSDTTSHKVVVAEKGMAMEPGAVYLASDGKHLTVLPDGQISLRSLPPVDGHCPSVTALFESVAKYYGPHAVGVLLTGMGRDGARGLKAMRDAGAYTIAQDEASCVVYGMPKEAVALGGAKEIMPIDQIGSRILGLLIRRG
ncbi:MAG: chemotaxis-specific protein-glutamate methyltransferase CheB [Desulfatibacillaceae bacterium]